jgi:hypothetical protein
MENSTDIPQKTRHKTATWSSNSTTGCLSKWNEMDMSKRHLHSHVYCSAIHNVQCREST